MNLRTSIRRHHRPPQMGQAVRTRVKCPASVIGSLNGLKRATSCTSSTWERNPQLTSVCHRGLGFGKFSSPVWEGKPGEEPFATSWRDAWLLISLAAWPSGSIGNSWLSMSCYVNTTWRDASGPHFFTQTLHCGFLEQKLTVRFLSRRRMLCPCTVHDYIASLVTAFLLWKCRRMSVVSVKSNY